MTLKSKIQSLLQAVEISRANATHFTNVASYWSWNVESYCAEDDCCKDCSSSSSHHDLPSLTTTASSSKCSVGDSKSPITIHGKSIMMMRRESEPEFEEAEEQ